MKESVFQKKVIDRLKREFPGCIVLKNDPTYLQGFPDLTVLYYKKWAVLECKVSRDAWRQPNQDYYVDRLGDMGFADFIFPEYFDEVFEEMREYFNAVE